MTVYVDEPIFPYGRMVMCHMVADSIKELHEMADRIGIQRKWFQDKRVPHYDICKSKRAVAVRLGAKEVNREDFVQIVRRQALTLPSPTPAERARVKKEER